MIESLGSDAIEDDLELGGRGVELAGEVLGEVDLGVIDDLIERVCQVQMKHAIEKEGRDGPRPLRAP